MSGVLKFLLIFVSYYKTHTMNINVTVKRFEQSKSDCSRFLANSKPNIDKIIDETDLRLPVKQSLKAHNIHTVRELKEYYEKNKKKIHSFKHIGYSASEDIFKLMGVNEHRYPLVYHEGEFCTCNYCKPIKRKK